jgi:hypothetical protein
VTITSILRVTAVANSVRNQQDQTWNFIQRGIWTLIEANLGIICACLIVLNQAVRRFFSMLFNGFRTGTGSGPRNGPGSGGTAGSAGRDGSTLRSRLHQRFDDTVDDEYTPPEVRTKWRKGRSEQMHMTSLAYRDNSNDRHKSDEALMFSSTHTRTAHCHGSVASVDFDHGAQGAGGITKSVELQVTCHPSSSHLR